MQFVCFKIPNIWRLLIIFLFGYQVVAQNQNNQWRFGNNGGVSFSTNPPSFVNGSSITTGEGSASIADRTTGNLLFYTNGLTVWDASDAIMQNGTGLLGGATLSSTTAAVILPVPGSSTTFYIITIDEQFDINGIRYSVVDMSLNGGLGGIVTNQKNIFLWATQSEKLHVVPTSDGEGYWLLSNQTIGNDFLAFKISSSGISNSPVISTVGSTQGSGAGHLKVNRQFNKLAIGNFFDGSIELYDFNNTTGVVSDGIIWSTAPGVTLVYGIEFSPDGTKLYTSDIGRIFQYDISSNDAAVIESSEYLVAQNNSATLQLGPDDKIYCNSGAIDVINCPNFSGAACGFQQAVILNQNGGGGYGLPQWIYYPDDAPIPTVREIVVDDSCLSTGSKFTLSDALDVQSVLWDFGDPTSGTANTSGVLNPTHIFSAVGDFTVTANITTSCGLIIVSAEFSIVNCDSTTITGIKISGDPCTSLTLDLQAEGVSNSPFFSWNFDDPDSGTNNTIVITGASASPFPTHTFSNPGAYNVCVSFQEPGFPIATVCRTIFVGFCCNGIISSSDNCFQNTIPFAIISDSDINSISWDFGDPASGTNNTSNALNPNHTFTAIGNYFVTATVNAICGTFIVPFTQNIVGAIPAFTISPTLCSGTTAPVLPPTSDNGITGIWSPSLVSNLVDDTYTFTPNGGQCASVISINIDVTATTITPVFTLNSTLCSGTTAPVLPPTSDNGITGIWSPNLVSNLVDDTYTFTPNGGQCAAEVTLFITVNQVTATSFTTIVSAPFADVSSVTVLPTDNGMYFYQLDSGPLQTSNVFENVSAGIHVVIVYDQNDCSAPTTADVIIIDYPKFFTPNGDGFNDTWNIEGLLFQTNSKIFIFDRYGKLLKQIVPFGSGWDGTYNGNPLPSTDYWFTVDYEYNNKQLQFKSHFSLKR